MAPDLAVLEPRCIYPVLSRRNSVCSASRQQLWELHQLSIAINERRPQDSTKQSVASIGRRQMVSQWTALMEGYLEGQETLESVLLLIVTPQLTIHYP